MAITRRSRVLAGARLLDEQCPKWEKDIDLERLEMDSCRRCILGQLFGDYNNGKLALGLITGAVFGFNEVGSEDVMKFPELTAMWKRLVARRRLQTATADLKKYL